MLTYIIDDDSVSLFLTEQVLRMENATATVLPFTTAAEALSYLLLHIDTDLPQLILLDLNIPVMDGWDFLAALGPYQAALHGRCHIYLLTSSLAPSDIAKSEATALVAGIIHKPIDKTDIKVIEARLQDSAAS